MSAVKDIYTHLHLHGNELRGIALERLQSDPEPIDGGLYYNVSTKEFRACVSGVWISLFSPWYADDEGNICTDKQVIIKNNLIVSGDTSSGGEGQDTPSAGLNEEQLQAYLDEHKYVTEDDIAGLIPDVDLSDYYTKGQTDSAISTAIAGLINGAPTTLDTLKEIADALAENEDVVDALEAAIGTKANASDLTALTTRVGTAETNITNLTNGKANKATSLAGYGITNAYTKTEIDSKVTAINTSISSVSGRVTTLETWKSDIAKYITIEDGNVKISTNLIVTGDTSSGGSGEDTGAEGTVTGIKVNGKLYEPTAGIVTIPDYPTSLTWDAISGKPTKLSQFTDDVVSGKYLPLVGGSLSGGLNVAGALVVQSGNLTVQQGWIQNSVAGRGLYNVEGDARWYYHGTDRCWKSDKPIWVNNSVVYHTGNLTKSTLGLGNVENTALSTWAGSTNITKLGTIATGVWNGSKISNAYLANNSVTIAGLNVSLGGSIAASNMKTALGLGSLAYKSSLSFSEVASLPTTLQGYGITDTYTKAAVDLKVTTINTSISSLSGRVTTLETWKTELSKYITIEDGNVKIGTNLIVTGDTSSGGTGQDVPETGLVTGVKVNGSLYAPVDGVVTIPNYPTSLTWSAISGKPSFATVATSGKYSDLSGTPTIPTSLASPYALTINNSAGTAQVTYNGSAAKSLTLTKAMVGLGSVTNLAASGYLTALSSNSTNAVSITVGGTTKAITVATMRSSLGLAAVAVSGEYSDLSGTPTIPSMTPFTLSEINGTAVRVPNGVHVAYLTENMTLNFVNVRPSAADHPCIISIVKTASVILAIPVLASSGCLVTTAAGAASSTALSLGALKGVTLVWNVRKFYWECIIHGV